MTTPPHKVIVSTPPGYKYSPNNISIQRSPTTCRCVVTHRYKSFVPSLNKAVRSDYADACIQTHPVLSLYSYNSLSLYSFPVNHHRPLLNRFTWQFKSHTNKAIVSSPSSSATHTACSTVCPSAVASMHTYVRELSFYCFVAFSWKLWKYTSSVLNTLRNLVFSPIF